MNPTVAEIREPIIELPTGRLVVTGVVAGAAALAGWATATAVLGRPELIIGGAAGVVLVTVLTIGSLLVLRPWKPRRVTGWANLWLAALVGRLLLTPALAYLLYSATPLDLVPLMLSVAVTYLVVQLTEAAILALHLKRIT